MGASMQLPGATAWVPQTPTQLTPGQTPNNAMPQAIAYPTMQQFQVSPQVNLFISLPQDSFAFVHGSLKRRKLGRERRKTSLT
jgi:hypothetical protein